MNKYINLSTKMSKKILKKIKCNLTGYEMQIYEDYYDKKVKQYGSEENLLKYYIQNKIINLIKAGHDFDYIAKLFNFEYKKENEPFYKELRKFYSTNFGENNNKNSFVETDPDVKNFIDGWITFNKNK